MGLAFSGLPAANDFAVAFVVNRTSTGMPDPTYLHVVTAFSTVSCWPCSRSPSALPTTDELALAQFGPLPAGCSTVVGVSGACVGAASGVEVHAASRNAAA